MQSAGFENSNLVPRLKWEVSLSDHSCVGGDVSDQQNKFVQSGDNEREGEEDSFT